MMERLQPGFAERLHRPPFNPYSQYCALDKAAGQLIWRINALNDEAAAGIIAPLQALSEVSLKAPGIKLKVLDSKREDIDLKGLAALIQGSGGQAKSKLAFLTPTAFKSGGSYVNMPTLRLVFQNLLMHYSQVYEGDLEVEPETVDYIDQHARIIAYNLRSQSYANAAEKGQRIPAFVGAMTISVKGPAPLVGLSQMLLRFAEYSGVGIKTAMGMGGVQLA